MKFNIISINDDRLDYKNGIRNAMEWDEIFIRSYNAKTHNPVEGISDRKLEWHSWDNAKRGELGVWLSNYDCWLQASRMDEPLVVFEDDAIIPMNFNDKFMLLTDELPGDWDFVALWVPNNQLQDYLYNVEYDKHGNPRFSGYLRPEESKYRIPGKEYVSLVYQGYGMVSLMYSPTGAQKLVDLAHERGIDGPVDCWIYQEAHRGSLNGYAPVPWQTPVVDYNWSAPSHVQQTERVT